MKLLEEIKSVDGYLVSNCGRIVSPSGRQLKQTIHHGGYRMVAWPRKGNSRRHSIPVHRLVALAFCDNPLPLFWRQINHRDGDTGNNRADNLEWCDNAYNNREKFALRLRKGLPLHTPAELAAIERRRKPLRTR